MTSQVPLIAVDWGTSSLRGARLGAAGEVLEERTFARGILSVATGALRWVLVPSPRRPKVFKPHAKPAPSALMASVWAKPPPMRFTLVRFTTAVGAVRAPSVLSPSWP